LNHHGEEADGFERCGFPAGIGSGDHEDFVLVFQFQRKRNRSFLILEVKEGMVSPQDFDVSLLYNFRDGEIMNQGEPGFGMKKVELNSQARVRVKNVLMGTGNVAEFDKDPHDFIADPVPDGCQVIGEFDNFQRFYKDRLASAGHVMKNALDPAPGCGPDRKDIPIAPQCIKILLKKFLLDEETDKAVQILLDPAFGRILFPEEFFQSRRGVVPNLTLFINLGADEVCKFRKRSETLKFPPEKGGEFPVMGKKSP